MSMREHLVTIKNDLERVSKLGPMQQIKEIWPIVWKLWALMAVMVEKIEEVEHGK